MNLMNILNHFLVIQTGSVRFFLFVLLLLSYCNLFSQGITVDDTSNSPEELANYLLDGSCSEIYNVAISSNRAVARFDKGDSNFPIESGDYYPFRNC